MDRIKLIEALGLIPAGTFWVIGVELVQWGREIALHTAYETVQPDGTPDTPVSFRLVFQDCRDFRWKSYAHIALSEEGIVSERSEIAELLFGSGHHRRDANLLTNHFGLTVSYGQVIVQYDGQTFDLTP
ncbi:MAG: hypothetical protein MUF87_17350 [Anaerolineae bacterium]|jgi:hypothetical protein|nr:hypothetical protein [Anaerolineae bacterium]